MIDLAVLVPFSLSDWMPILSPMVSTHFWPTRASTLHPGRIEDGIFIPRMDNIMRIEDRGECIHL